MKEALKTFGEYVVKHPFKVILTLVACGVIGKLGWIVIAAI